MIFSNVMNDMDMKQYDGKCVRIINISGDVFDGICCYNDEEYNDHEYGRCEEGLKIENFLFYKSDIREIHSLEEHSGPYGRFHDPYGTLEIMTVEDGFDSIDDILFSEENEHVLRLLNCLDRYLDPSYGYELSCRKEVLEALDKLIRVNESEEVQEKAGKLLKKYQ